MRSNEVSQNVGANPWILEVFCHNSVRHIDRGYERERTLNNCARTIEFTKLLEIHKTHMIWKSISFISTFPSVVVFAQRFGANFFYFRKIDTVG